MTRRWRPLLILACAASMGGAAGQAAPDAQATAPGAPIRATVCDIIADPARFDGRVVAINALPFDDMRDFRGLRDRVGRCQAWLPFTETTDASCRQIEDYFLGRFAGQRGRVVATVIGRVWISRATVGRVQTGPPRDPPRPHLRTLRCADIRFEEAVG